MRRETEGHCRVGTVILAFLTIFKKHQASSTFEALNNATLSMCQRDVRPLVQMSGDLGLSIRSLQGIQTSLHLVIWKMSLGLSLFRDIWPSFESGHLGVHFTWSRKHRLPLTYIFLRENSTRGACGKLAYLFSRKQGISSHLQTIWGARSFPPIALLKLMFL